MRPTLTFALALFALSCGCSSAPDDGPDLYPAEGLVLLDGEPVEGATVVFNPKDGRRGATGQTDAGGRFEMYYIGTKGSPAGLSQVVISTRGDKYDEYGGTVGVTPEKIPDRYRGNSELTADVRTDGENSFLFELTSE